ncbi:FAD-binding domain-containing protein [Kaistella polysaccharea]|uniref:FAD-binding domain-containing protein n=1 Tax=Kaistella polysaccharea TaxID=2878534 RepID=UPI001CF52A3B|nr:FAD-binding domain-containing protein [Kaistella polysaccharea]
MEFPTDFKLIKNRITVIDPIKYGSTRNFGDGAVTKLSPYISRGVISTREVFNHLKTLDLNWLQVERLVQELAWRDFFQNVWKEKGDQIFSNLKQRQENVENHEIPTAILKGKTGIQILDDAVKTLYETSYLHNHLRMYLATVCCNIAHCHWSEPAKWLYSNLLDGDLASNHLSWQWIAGSFSTKKYFANQDNLNKYFGGTQKNTFLDVDYSDFESLKTPDILRETENFSLQTDLTGFEIPKLVDEKTLIYTYYNLDPTWHQSEDFQRVFLLEPSLFEKYPVTKKVLNFAVELSKNIRGLKIYVGEFSVLNQIISTKNITFKEHPTNSHFEGIIEKRSVLSNLDGDFKSFFSYWKKIKKDLQQEFEMR